MLWKLIIDDDVMMMNMMMNNDDDNGNIVKHCLTHFFLYLGPCVWRCFLIALLSRNIWAQHLIVVFICYLHSLKTKGKQLNGGQVWIYVAKLASLQILKYLLRLTVTTTMRLQFLNWSMFPMKDNWRQKASWVQLDQFEVSPNFCPCETMFFVMIMLMKMIIVISTTGQLNWFRHLWYLF